jgi:tetratricopeptide (TPR) repeat protein
MSDTKQESIDLYSLGRRDESERASRRAIELSDTGNPVRTYAAHVLARLGHEEEAIRLFEEVATTRPGTPYGLLCAFTARAMRRDHDGAVAHVTPQLEQAAHWVEYLGWILAGGYALIGRRDDAMRWLHEAVDRGFINYPMLASKDAFLESLRGDAEYESLMRQVERRWRAIEI